MKPKKQNKPITAGNVKQINIKKEKNDFRTINYNNKAKKEKNELYSLNKNIFHHLNDIKKEKNTKIVADISESIKRGRNTSAPALKKIKINNKNNNKNTKANFNKKANIEEYSSNKIKNKMNNSYMLEKRDEKKDLVSNNKNNISFDKTKNEKSKYNYSNKITKINRRIKDIKNSFNSKTNRKYYNNHINNDNNHINNINNNESNTNNLLNKSFNEKIKSTNLAFKNILASKEKILMMKKQLKENNFYYKSLNGKNNTNDEEEKKIVIDNGENILLSTDGNLKMEENNNNNNRKIYRDITPDKNINSHKKNIMNTSGFSYSKKSENISKTNNQKKRKTRNEQNNNFNFNFNTHKNNRSYMNPKNENKRSTKINVINLKTKQNDYYYTKSSNIFNLMNKNKNIKINKINLNKTTITPNNPNKNIKTKLNNSFNIKKNNSILKTKINNNNNYINKLIIGKKNTDKTKIQKNKVLNYTSDRNDKKSNINNLNSSKINKKEPKCDVFKNIENMDKSEQKESIEIEIDTNKEDIRNNNEEKKLIKNIGKIGCVCHAGEISFGQPKTNQDNYFNYNFNSEDLTFVGVCDGHGEYGHYVSEFLINHLPLDLQDNYLKLKNEDDSLENLDIEKITQIFEESFLKTDNDLNFLCDVMKTKKLTEENKMNPNSNLFNCDYSGSTCVSLLLRKKNINTVYVANVGDSRTIVLRENNNEWECEQLSRDHKPTEKDEYKRIIDMDGEIEAIEDDNGNWTGPLRVWEKRSEGPGLAMTRSLGDKIGAKIGVICTPEITKYSIREEDRAFIIASDGLWEYMPNEHVCEFVKDLILDMRLNNKEIDPDFIAKELFNQSVIRWRQKEQGMDDITIIVVFLEDEKQ